MVIKRTPLGILISRAFLEKIKNRFKIYYFNKEKKCRFKYQKNQQRKKSFQNLKKKEKRILLYQRKTDIILRK